MENSFQLLGEQYVLVFENLKMNRLFFSIKQSKPIFDYEIEFLENVEIIGNKDKLFIQNKIFSFNFLINNVCDKKINDNIDNNNNIENKINKDNFDSEYEYKIKELNKQIENFSNEKVQIFENFQKQIIKYNNEINELKNKIKNYENNNSKQNIDVTEKINQLKDINNNLNIETKNLNDKIKNISESEDILECKKNIEYLINNQNSLNQLNAKLINETEDLFKNKNLENCNKYNNETKNNVLYEKEINNLNEKINSLLENNKNLNNNIINLNNEVNNKNNMIINLEKYISKLEEGIGVSEQIENFKNIIEEKEEKINNLNEIINIYKNDINDIVNNNNIKDEEKKLLIKEIKKLKIEIENILNFNKKINFKDLIDLLEDLKKEIENNKILEKIFNRLNYLLSIYKKYNENYLNNLFIQIFS